MSTEIVQPISEWFAREARPLPWRSSEATAWHVLISEFMLQQTPVARVLPMYERWVNMFPIPSALAGVPVSESVRQWGRLGYPRRAQRLHAVSVILDRDYDDQVPSDYEHLRALPGVGEYTAAAIMAFAFQRRSVVVDTNIRRVLARAVDGQQWPSLSLTRAEMNRAEGLVPDSDAAASQWSAAVMELGAVVCTASNPQCGLCPIAGLCAWQKSGAPTSPRPHRTQAWHGTDRQCRGLIVQRLRDAEDPVPTAELRSLWPDAQQFENCLMALREEKFVRRSRQGWLLA